MSVSPYTLQNLYNKGILDYVPMELASSANVSSLAGMQNPYLNMAAQGGLYQNYGMQQDSFSYTGANSGINNQMNYQNGMNNFGSIRGNFGFNNASQAGMNEFGGINGNIGMNNPQAGMNGFGGVNGNMMMNNPQAGINGFGGGFGKLGAEVSNTVSNTPSIVKGLIAAGIMIGTTALLFKRGKKAPVKQQTNHNFFDKLKFWKK